MSFTPLQRKALVRTVLTQEAMGAIYHGDYSGTEQILKEVCESHERLRLENIGLLTLQQEDLIKIERLNHVYETARSLIDTLDSIKAEDCGDERFVRKLKGHAALLRDALQSEKDETK